VWKKRDRQGEELYKGSKLIYNPSKKKAMVEGGGKRCSHLKEWGNSSFFEKERKGKNSEEGR